MTLMIYLLMVSNGSSDPAGIDRGNEDWATSLSQTPREVGGGREEAT